MMIVVVILLILMSAIFSGLTIGMFSLSLSGLERKIKLGNVQAKRVYDIRKNGNFLLCTLLLGNVAVNSAVSVVMSELSTGLVAGLISTVLIFVFGEVIPQALFSRYALAFGSKTVWLIRILMILMWLIAKPMSMALDFFFGKEFPELFSKRELQAIIEDHDGNEIDSDERRIIIGAMRFSERKAIDVITPITVLYRIEASIILDTKVLASILHEHYSRIPVYEKDRDNIVGILYAKDLINYESIQGKSAGEMCRKDGLIFINEEVNLDSLLNYFIKHKVHMSFVFDKYDSLTGIVTLEDIIEEIIDKEILDESDTVADLQHAAMKKSTKNVLMK